MFGFVKHFLERMSVAPVFRDAPYLIQVKACKPLQGWITYYPLDDQAGKSFSTKGQARAFASKKFLYKWSCRIRKANSIESSVNNFGNRVIKKWKFIERSHGR